MNEIKELRTQLGLSRGYLSIALGINLKLIEIYELEKNQFRGKTYNRILDYLKKIKEEEGGKVRLDIFHIEELTLHKNYSYKQKNIRVITTKEEIYFACNNILNALELDDKNVKHHSFLKDCILKPFKIKTDKYTNGQTRLYFISQTELKKALSQSKHKNDANMSELYLWINKFITEDEAKHNTTPALVTSLKITSESPQSVIPNTKASLIVKHLEENYEGALYRIKELEAIIDTFKDAEKTHIQQIKNLQKYKDSEDERHAELKKKLNEYEAKVLFADEILAIKKNLEL